MKISNKISLLIVIATQVVVGCTPYYQNCDNGLVQDITRPHIFEIFKGDGCQTIDPSANEGCISIVQCLAYEYRENYVNFLSHFVCERRSSGGNVRIEFSLTPDFSSLLNERRALNYSTGVLNSNSDLIQLGGHPEIGVTVYVRVMEGTNQLWSNTHTLNFHDDTVDGDPVCYRSYRKVEVTMLAPSTTTLVGDVAGITLSRNNETQMCTLVNTSDTAVHFVLEIPDRSIVAIQIVYMTPGQVVIKECQTLQDGDIVLASVWIGYVESILNLIRDYAPNRVAEIIWSNDKEVKINRILTNESVIFVINRTLGVDCQIESMYSNSGNDTSISSNLHCLNNSSDNVEVSLYQLKEDSICDDNNVCANAWVIDFEITSLNLDKAGDFGDDDLEELSTFGLGTYMLVVETSWLSDSDLIDYQPFQIYVDGGGREITNLDIEVSTAN